MTVGADGGGAPMSRGLFIVGTERGVGQTVVGTALAAALVRRGHAVGVMKPVAVGCAPDSTGTDGEAEALARLALVAGPAPATLALPRAALRADDALQLMRAAGCSTLHVDTVNPYRFLPAVEPAVAARAAGVDIDVELLVRSFRELAAHAEWMVVEGCCGLMAPLTGEALMVDLIARLELPVLLVAPSRGGATNACLLAAEVLAARGLSLAGVVLNRLAPEVAPEEAANPYQIERFCGAVVRGVLPFFDAPQLADPEVLARRLEVHVDVAALLG
jgi:dethiobiotin synthetase